MIETRAGVPIGVLDGRLQTQIDGNSSAIEQLYTKFDRLETKVNSGLDNLQAMMRELLQKQHTGENTLNVLPMLCNLFLEQSEPSGPFPETIQPFIAARELAGHPVVVHHQEGGDWRAIG